MEDVIDLVRYAVDLPGVTLTPERRRGLCGRPA